MFKNRYSEKAISKLTTSEIMHKHKQADNKNSFSIIMQQEKNKQFIFYNKHQKAFCSFLVSSYVAMITEKIDSI